MFKIVAEPVFKHTVDVLTPADGGHTKESFKATFKVLPNAKLREFDLATEEGGTEFLRAAIVSMEELADPDGKPLPYSDELRDQLLQMPHVRMALGRSYWAAVNKAALGNSNGPAAHG